MHKMNSNRTAEISVAPMMDWTNRHCRYFHRLIAPHVTLYTEMVTTGALLHGDAERFLRFDEAEHPIVLQLGGSDPVDLARCSEMAQARGYDEINLNCGCPSERVQKGAFGACLMNEPDLVASCMEAMISAVDIPVTIKCRIGVDEQDDYDFLARFVEKSAAKGVDKFIVHARKAWLSGLSPKQNREIPPLLYDRAVAIKDAFPQLNIQLNGGMVCMDDCGPYIDILDGFMIGREAYKNPYMLAEFERKIYGHHEIMGRDKIARAMAAYADAQLEEHGTPVKSITRHILGLYHHQPGAKAWKRYLSDHAHLKDARGDVILEALSAVQHERTRRSHNDQIRLG